MDTHPSGNDNNQNKLKINYRDFILTIKANKKVFKKSKEKAKKYNDDNFLSEYIICFNNSKLDLNTQIPFKKEEKLLENNCIKIIAHPFFFENIDYNILVNFKENTAVAKLDSDLIRISSKIFFYDEKNLLTGTINFYNNIGKSSIILKYTKEDTTKKEENEFHISFEVFPTKLNYKKDLKSIVNYIEDIYPKLVLSYLQSTFINFSAIGIDNNKIIWWNIFRKIYTKLIKTFKYILEKPHKQIDQREVYLTADKIKKWNITLEEEFIKYKHIPNKKYQTIYYYLSLDIVENRFFKYISNKTKNYFKNIKDYIERKYDLTDDFKDELKYTLSQLKKVANNSLFSKVGEFKGFKQQSLIMEKDPGYSNLYKAWILLKSSYKLFEGSYKASLKNIAELYQIWCFLKIKEIIESIIKTTPINVKIENIFDKNDNSVIENSVKTKIVYKTEKLKIEILHEYEFSPKTNHITTYTLNQRPDITLKITKNDLIDNYTFTYLFDAKYRININNDGDEFPPEDAINQMHRYRDAIYYKKEGKPKKEIIGAYVLFPSRLSEERLKKQNYFKSIDEINIGAFPLVPGSENNHLTKFLKRILIDKNSAKILEKDIIPQKDLKYEPVDPIVLIGFVPDEKHLKCIHNNNFYFTGKNKPTRFGFNKLKYFAPYIKGKGIREYFKINSYEIKKRDEIFGNRDQLYKNEKSERLIINLSNKKYIKKDKKYIKIVGGMGRSIYRYTYLSNIRNPEKTEGELKIKTYKKEEMLKIDGIWRRNKYG